jgi:hypothetical protein
MPRLPVCTRCRGQLYSEADLDRPALREWVCLQCGARTSYEVPVLHPPAEPEDERMQVVFAEAKATSIAHMRLVQHASRGQIGETLGVSPRTIDRALRRAGGGVG